MSHPGPKPKIKATDNLRMRLKKKFGVRSIMPYNKSKTGNISRVAEITGAKNAKRILPVKNLHAVERQMERMFSSPKIQKTCLNKDVSAVSSTQPIKQAVQNKEGRVSLEKNASCMKPRNTLSSNSIIPSKEGVQKAVNGSQRKLKFIDMFSDGSDLDDSASAPKKPKLNESHSIANVSLNNQETSKNISAKKTVTDQPGKCNSKIVSSSKTTSSNAENKTKKYLTKKSESDKNGGKSKEPNAKVLSNIGEKSSAQSMVGTTVKENKNDTKTDLNSGDKSKKLVLKKTTVNGNKRCNQDDSSNTDENLKKYLSKKTTLTESDKRKSNCTSRSNEKLNLSLKKSTLGAPSGSRSNISKTKVNAKNSTTIKKEDANEQGICHSKDSSSTEDNKKSEESVVTDRSDVCNKLIKIESNNSPQTDKEPKISFARESYLKFNEKVENCTACKFSEVTASVTIHSEYLERPSTTKSDFTVEKPPVTVSCHSRSKTDEKVIIDLTGNDEQPFNEDNSNSLNVKFEQLEAEFVKCETAGLMKTENDLQESSKTTPFRSPPGSAADENPGQLVASVMVPSCSLSFPVILDIPPVCTTSPIDTSSAQSNTCGVPSTCTPTNSSPVFPCNDRTNNSPNINQPNASIPRPSAIPLGAPVKPVSSNQNPIPPNASHKSVSSNHSPIPPSASQKPVPSNLSGTSNHSGIPHSASQKPIASNNNAISHSASEEPNPSNHSVISPSVPFKPVSSNHSAISLNGCAISSDVVSRSTANIPRIETNPSNITPRSATRLLNNINVIPTHTLVSHTSSISTQRQQQLQQQQQQQQIQEMTNTSNSRSNVPISNCPLQPPLQLLQQMPQPVPPPPPYVAAGPINNTSLPPPMKPLARSDPYRTCAQNRNLSSFDLGIRFFPIIQKHLSIGKLVGDLINGMKESNPPFSTSDQNIFVKGFEQISAKQSNELMDILLNVDVQGLGINIVLEAIKNKLCTEEKVTLSLLHIYFIVQKLLIPEQCLTEFSKIFLAQMLWVQAAIERKRGPLFSPAQEAQFRQQIQSYHLLRRRTGELFGQSTVARKGTNNVKRRNSGESRRSTVNAANGSLLKSMLATSERAPPVNNVTNNNFSVRSTGAVIPNSSTWSREANNTNLPQTKMPPPLTQPSDACTFNTVIASNLRNLAAARSTTVYSLGTVPTNSHADGSLSRNSSNAGMCNNYSRQSWSSTTNVTCPTTSSGVVCPSLQQTSEIIPNHRLPSSGATSFMSRAESGLGGPASLVQGQARVGHTMPSYYPPAGANTSSTSVRSNLQQTSEVTSNYGSSRSGAASVISRTNSISVGAASLPHGPTQVEHTTSGYRPPVAGSNTFASVYSGGGIVARDSPISMESHNVVPAHRYARRFHSTDGYSSVHARNTSDGTVSGNSVPTPKASSDTPVPEFSPARASHSSVFPETANTGLPEHRQSPIRAQSNNVSSATAEESGQTTEPPPKAPEASHSSIVPETRNNNFPERPSSPKAQASGISSMTAKERTTTPLPETPATPTVARIDTPEADEPDLVDIKKDIQFMNDPSEVIEIADDQDLVDIKDDIKFLNDPSAVIEIADDQDLMDIKEGIKFLNDPSAVIDVDLVWLDDVDPEEIAREMEACQTVKVEVDGHDIEINIVDRPGATESTDSGLGSPIDFQTGDDFRCICGKSATYVCACSQAMYCGDSCQNSDWADHQNFCEKVRQTREED